MTTKDQFRLRPDEVPAADPTLGHYIEGYTDAREKFNYKNLWWILLPFFGWVMVLFFILGYWLKHIRYWRVAVFENGFLKQTVTRSGRIAEEQIFRFNEIRGISNRVTRRYQSTYGITRYTGTDVSLHVLDNNGNETNFLSGSYRNEHDHPEKYNMEGYAVNAIVKAWYPVSIDNFNREMDEKGYGTFVSGGNEIQVGKGFLRAGQNHVSGHFRYGVDSGFLTIQPENEDGAHFSGKLKAFSININEMYNSQAFCTAAAQLLGIK
ncbi:MAG: hypothetical protein OSJ46_02740 [Duncaniella sp.]|nr:hypothetical protein [Duncaniella sp.]HBI58071.1 hypothetical protein [Porphyromonadaceae bacterium]